MHKPYYDGLETRNAGYALHIREIREYAALTAFLLGRDPAGLEEKERISLYQGLLEEHPYAYPLALELSLYMPPLTAVAWLHDLVEAYYDPQFTEITREINAFLLWRMRPLPALFAALEHAGNESRLLPSAEKYLEENFPMLSAYVQKRRTLLARTHMNLGDWRTRIDDCVRVAAGAIRSAILFLTREEELPRKMLVFYVNNDKPQPQSLDTRLKKIPVWLIMRMLSRKTSLRDKRLSRAAWMRLPEQSDPQTGSAATPVKKTCYAVSTIIWGEEYVRRFARYNLPSLLADGNLPALAADEAVTFVLYTTRDDMERIRALPEYAELRRYVSVKFIFMDRVLRDVPYAIVGKKYNDKYLPMTAMHNHFWRLTMSLNQFAIFNQPDLVLQGDTYARLVALRKQGKRVVFVHPGPVVILEGMEKSLCPMLRNGVLDVGNAVLRKLCLEHVHPCNNVFYENSRQNFYLANIHLRTVEDEGFVFHTTCVMPLMAKPDSSVLNMHSTIDWFLLFSPFSRAKDIHIARDNTEIAIASLEPERGIDDSLRIGSSEPSEFVTNLRANSRLFNRVLFARPLRYYYSNTHTETLWENAETASQAYTGMFLKKGKHVLPPLEYFFTPEHFLPTTPKNTYPFA